MHRVRCRPPAELANDTPRPPCPGCGATSITVHIQVVALIVPVAAQATVLSDGRVFLAKHDAGVCRGFFDLAPLSCGLARLGPCYQDGATEGSALRFEGSGSESDPPRSPDGQGSLTGV